MILAKAVGAGKTALITFFFRPGSSLDAYLLAFLFVSFFIEIFFGSLNPVLVPALVDARHMGNARWTDLYASSLWRSVTLAIVVSAGVALAGCVAGLTGRFAETLSPVLLIQILLMLPMLPVTALACVWRSVLHAELRFGPANFSYIFTPLLATVVLLLAHARGIEVLAIGSTAGAMAEALFLAAALRHYQIPAFPTRVSAVHTLFPMKQYGAVVAGSLSSKGAIAVDQAAAAFSGIGGLSIFNLGTRLTVLLIATGPGALGAAILPRFASLLSKGDRAGARQCLISVIGRSAAVMALVALLLISCSDLLVRLAYSHGALSGADLVRVTLVQRWSLVQVPFSVGLAILVPFAASLRANHAILPIWIAALGGHALFDFLALARYGVEGVACVSAGMEAVLLGAMLIAVFRELRQPALNTLPGSAIQVCEFP